VHEDPPAAGRRHRRMLPVLLVACALAVAVLLTGLESSRHYCSEAQVRASVAGDVVSARARGTQGLVGSLSLAPLPTVLIILMGLLPFVSIGPALNAVVGAGGAVLLAVSLDWLWRRHRVSAAVRYPAVACVLLMPPVVLSIQRGEATMLFAALVVLGAASLAEWARTPSTGLLAVSGLAFSLAVATRFQGLLFVAAGLVLIAAAALMWRGGWSYAEGTAITFAFPTAYVALLWIGGNWLVLRSPLFFLRALRGPLALGTTTPFAVFQWDCPWVLLGSLVLLALSVPLTVAVVGRRPAFMHAVAVAAVVLAAAWGIAAQERRPPAEPKVGEARQLVRLLELTYPNGTFIVTGYAGYDFIDAAAPDPHHHWVHIMHLRPEALTKVLEDYTGREVYLLLDTAEARGRWDEVGLLWQEPGYRVPERFLFARQAGTWALFEVLRAQD
jgi:hypothetical protein